MNPQQRVRAQKFREFEILEEHEDIDVASIRERELQEEYGYGNDSTALYRHTVGLRERHTEETNRKRAASTSKALKGRPHSEEHKAAVREALEPIWEARRGVPRSKEALVKTSQTLKEGYASGRIKSSSKIYIELSTGEMGKARELASKFGLSMYPLYHSVNTGQPVGLSKGMTLYFKIYEE